MQTKQSFLKNRRAHKQLGMSLPLMAIFIGVAAIFVVVAIIYGTRYFQQSKASNEITALSDLKANIVSYGSRVGTFTAANSSLAVLVGQGLFPRSLVGGTAAAPTVTNQWGGAVTVAVGVLRLEPPKRRHLVRARTRQRSTLRALPALTTTRLPSRWAADREHQDDENASPTWNLFARDGLRAGRGGDHPGRDHPATGSGSE